MMQNHVSIRKNVPHLPQIIESDEVESHLPERVESREGEAPVELQTMENVTFHAAQRELPPPGTHQP
ncbi:MAG TPA: hypothetical protein VNQ76_16635 [Planctomicrobium sp.]|nr:hypothetical protein [Planctomicrobium sp.]